MFIFKEGNSEKVENKVNTVFSHTSEAQTDPELLQHQPSVSVSVAVLSELLGASSRLQPPSQELTEGSSLAFAQHPAGVHVQPTEVPAQNLLRPGGISSSSSGRGNVRSGGGWSGGGRSDGGTGGDRHNQRGEG